MRIHGLCIVKNEADIIEEMLGAANSWCDNIYVFDNGSSDGTWEKVIDLSKEIPSVIPYKQDPKPFLDSLRDDILNAYKNRAHAGDWWCILDADEFCVDDPRSFLADVAPSCRAVWLQRYTYLFTDKDAAAFEENPVAWQSLPVADRLRFYVLGEHHELRFFRHDPLIRNVPSGAEFQPIHPELIRIRHYAYRSPEQIETRLQTRREPMARGEFIHEKKSNWQPDGYAKEGPALPSDYSTDWHDRVALSFECHWDDGEPSLLPPLPWIPPRSGSPKRSVGTRVKGKLRRVLQSLS